MRRQRVLGRGLHLALPCPCTHPLSSVSACRAEPGHRSPQTRLAQPRKHMHSHSPPPQVSARWISTDQANPLGPSEPGGTRPFTWRSTEVRAWSRRSRQQKLTAVRTPQRHARSMAQHRGSRSLPAMPRRGSLPPHTSRRTRNPMSRCGRRSGLPAPLARAPAAQRRRQRGTRRRSRRMRAARCLRWRRWARDGWGVCVGGRVRAWVRGCVGAWVRGWGGAWVRGWGGAPIDRAAALETLP